MHKSVKIMGIINATSDSLYGSILHEGMSQNLLLERLEKMILDGADILDIGGESTGPSSTFVSSDEEWERVEPVLVCAKTLKKKYPHVQISLDTYKSVVLERALKYEVDILNDVTALRGDPSMIDVLNKTKISVCVMYSVRPMNVFQIDVRTSTEIVNYDDVIKTIEGFFHERILFLHSHGVHDDRIILDPGMGSFVSGDPKYSFEILDRLDELASKFPQSPILVGLSRKGFTGMEKNGSGQWIMKYGADERLIPSLKLGAHAVKNGASILRVHDVAETKKMLSNSECA